MPDTVLELFENRVNQSSTRPALRRRVDGTWQSISWKEWWEISERIAAGLADAGIEPGDRIAIISETRAQWLFTDIAAQMLGAVTVPVYPSLGPSLVAHILADSGARAVVVADPSQLDKLVEVREELPDLEVVVWIDPETVLRYPDFKGRKNVRLADVLSDDDPWNRSLENLAATGRRRLAEDTLTVARLRRDVAPTDLATLVYTSGTTGAPRGVMLTHDNLVAQVDALSRLEIFSADDVQYLFLPLAHIFARVLYLAAVGCGVETVIAHDVTQLLVETREVKPTFFAAVPQIFEQVRSKIEAEAGAGGLRNRLFRVAERIGRESDRVARTMSDDGVIDRVGRRVLAEVKPSLAREMFGGEVRFAISGGASLAQETTEFFGAFGLQVLEGYGLTETTAVATVNLPGDHRPGTVGRPLPGVDITIDEDGEVLVQSRTVSPGYWRDQAATDASRDADGWFCTGDLGFFDRDGFLSISGRKKELIVTAGGKNVAPSAIETALETIPIVERAYAHGDDRPYVAALLWLKAEAVAQWASAHDVAVAETLAHPEFQDALEQAVAEVNQSSPGYAVVRRWAIVEEPFSEESGELTATGKLRRSAVAEHRAAEIENLYSREQ